MDQKEIKELIEFLVEKDIAEFEFERGDEKLRVKRGADAQFSGAQMSAQMAAHMTNAASQMAAAAVASGGQGPTAPMPAPLVSAAPTAPAAPVEEAGLHLVRSPIVGSYYESPSPGSPAFVKVGDKVQAGQVLCIVEAMKLMNEIESDAAGEIVKVMMANSQPVEYGQPLFAIRVK